MYYVIRIYFVYYFKRFRTVKILGNSNSISTMHYMESFPRRGNEKFPSGFSPDLELPCDFQTIGHPPQGYHHIQMQTTRANLAADSLHAHQVEKARAGYIPGAWPPLTSPDLGGGGAVGPGVVLWLKVVRPHHFFCTVLPQLIVESGSRLHCEATFRCMYLLRALTHGRS